MGCPAELQSAENPEGLLHRRLGQEFQPSGGGTQRIETETRVGAFLRRQRDGTASRPGRDDRGDGFLFLHQIEVILISEKPEIIKAGHVQGSLFLDDVEGNVHGLTGAPDKSLGVAIPDDCAVIQ